MVLQSPSASSNVANFTFLRNPLSELWVCEFWLLRCSTMVARAWPVCVEVIQDWLLAAPSQTSPPSCFYDTSILRYPFDLFNGSLWDFHWDAEMLMRFQWSWDADWSSESNEPAPLSLWHCDTELCSIEKRFLFISWAVLHHWKSMGQLWDAPAPQGCNFYPILRYGLTEPARLFKCGKFHISVKSTLWATRVKVFRNVKSMRFFWPLFRPWGEHRTPDRL